MKTATETRSELPGNASPDGENAAPTCCQQAAWNFEAARQRARTLTEVALRFVREHPVRSLIAAFEVGMIVGVLRGRRR